MIVLGILCVVVLLLWLRHKRREEGAPAPTTPVAVLQPPDNDAGTRPRRAVFRGHGGRM